LKGFSLLQIGGNLPISLTDDSSDFDDYDSDEVAETLKKFPDVPVTPPRDPTPEEIEGK